jgi:transcription-repair coupling factor (superfamily II helicase)
VDLYRRASGTTSLAEVDDLAEELSDRFGELPEPARNLLGLSRVKILARQAGASSVNYRSDALSVVGVTADPAQRRRLCEETGGVVGGREGRVTVRGSSLDPLALAERSLRTLQPPISGLQQDV